MAGEGELAIVLSRVDQYRVGAERLRPEVRDVPRGAVPLPCGRDVDDRVFEEIEPCGGEPRFVRAREGMASREARTEPKPLGPGEKFMVTIDPQKRSSRLYEHWEMQRAVVRRWLERTGSSKVAVSAIAFWSDAIARGSQAQGFEKLQVRRRGGGQHQQVDRASDVRRARRSIVDRALARRRHPLGRLRGPAEDGRHARLLRLPRERAADRAEADDPESRGAHGEKASPAPQVL